jgi:hypothetical protein
VGAAFAVLLGANPLNPEGRNTIQKITSEALSLITANVAARCCRRESYLALHAAEDLSLRHLPIALRMEEEGVCDQF